jgi:hypothetical protein
MKRSPDLAGSPLCHPIEMGLNGAFVLFASILGMFQLFINDSMRDE